MNLDRIFWLMCIVLAIVEFVRKDIDEAANLLTLALIFDNSADLKEIEAEVKRLRKGK